MDHPIIIEAGFDQTDEDILVYQVSDEALEAAAGPERCSATPSYALVGPCC